MINAAPPAAEIARSAVRLKVSDVPDGVVDDDELPSGPDDWGPSLLLPPVSDCGLGVDDGVVDDVEDDGVPGPGGGDVAGMEDGKGDDWSNNEDGVAEAPSVTLGDGNDGDDVTEGMASGEGDCIKIGLAEANTGVGVCVGDSGEGVMVSFTSSEGGVDCSDGGEGGCETVTEVSDCLKAGFDSKASTRATDAQAISANKVTQRALIETGDRGSIALEE